MEKVNASQESNEAGSCDATDLPKIMEMVNVNSSPTKALLLPSGEVRVEQQLPNVRSDETGSGETESSMKPSGSATGNIRNKTTLAPGHSLVDWIRLGNSDVDLTGVGGGIPRKVTLSELAKHNKQNDAWISIVGTVFNVTRYMDFHPGGIDELMKGVGKDATTLFDKVHGWVNYRSLLKHCVVGHLCRNPLPETNKTSKTAQSKSDENIDFSLDKVKIDWAQSLCALIFFYPTINNYQGVGYRISRKNAKRLVFNVILEKDILTHELALVARVVWPPVWSRNWKTMQVHFSFDKRTENFWTFYGSYASSREAVTNERIYKEYEVVSNTPVGKLVNLLVLRAEDYLELIPIGRHLEARIKVGDMEVSRYYTPVPPFLHARDAAPLYTDDCICLMIKRYPDGAVSPSITALKPLEKLTLSNGLGVFTLETFDRYSVIHMLAAGTGLTAMLGIIQRSLRRYNDVLLINLINFNKDEDNMFYVDHLEKATVDIKFKVTHILSQASDSWEGRRGTVSDELLKKLVGDCSPEGCVFVCGPKGFMTSAKKCLNNLNWKPHQMYEFDD